MICTVPPLLTVNGQTYTVNQIASVASASSSN